MKRTNPIAKASASRRAVYLYAKRTSCPGERAFDILLDNTGGWLGFFRLCASPARVRVKGARFERRQTVMRFSNLLLFSGHDTLYVYEVNRVLSRTNQETDDYQRRPHNVVLRN